MKIRIVGKRPLASCILHRPVVPLSRKVDPFRVPEFIAHEIQVTFAGEAERDEPDQLVQSDAAVDNRRVDRLVHVPVHFLIHQAKRDSLVADQRLVVAFGIADVLFLVAAIEEGVE